MGERATEKPDFFLGSGGLVTVRCMGDAQCRGQVRHLECVARAEGDSKMPGNMCITEARVLAKEPPARTDLDAKVRRLPRSDAFEPDHNLSTYDKYDP